MDDLEARVLAYAIGAMHRVAALRTTVLVGGASGAAIYDVIFWACSRCRQGWPAGAAVGWN